MRQNSTPNKTAMKNTTTTTPPLTDPPLLAAAKALLDARECHMLTETEWEDLARAIEPLVAIPAGAAQRFGYAQAHGLVRLIEHEGQTLLRQTALPDAVDAAAAFAQARRDGPGPDSDPAFVIEAVRADSGFQHEREDIEAALAFLVHLGLAEHDGLGRYNAKAGEDRLPERAIAAMNDLPQV